MHINSYCRDSFFRGSGKSSNRRVLMLIVASHIALAIPGNTIYVYVMARYMIIKHGIDDIHSPRRCIDVT